MGATQSFTTDLGLGVLPEIDPKKDFPLYAELVRLRNAIRAVADQLDQYTFGGSVSDILAGYAKLAGGNAFTGAQSIGFLTLVDGPTINIDGSKSNNFEVTLSGNRTLAVSNMKDGGLYFLWAYQDGTGGRTLTFPGGTTPVIVGTPGALNLFLMQYKASGDDLACSLLTTFF